MYTQNNDDQEFTAQFREPDNELFFDLKISKSLYNPDDETLLKSMCKSLSRSKIEFIRNCFRQIETNSFATLDFQTNVTILKWNFEIQLMEMLKRANMKFTDGKIHFIDLLGFF